MSEAMKNYKFFQNRQCEFFPCHERVAEDRFNCLFCYCPLYALGDQCGGCFSYTETGIKDCSNCIRPHIRENYEDILACMNKVLELAKKKGEAPEKT